MTEVMTGLVQYDLQPHAVELRELPVPEIGEDQVLLVTRDALLKSGSRPKNQDKLTQRAHK